MDYIKQLRELLRPLGIYNVDSGVSGAELQGLGTAMNEVVAALDAAEREACLLSAESTGLTAWEALLPFVPASSSVATRRSAIASLLRIDEASFTLSDINRTLSGCGITAQALETDTPMTVAVCFPNCRGTPTDFEALKVRIEQILPCHLEIEYRIIYLCWQELEALFVSWSALTAQTLSWDALERTGGEET